MSRIGKRPIDVPDQVKIAIKDGVVEVQGPNGSLLHQIPSGIDVSISPKSVEVKRKDDSREMKSLHGITRTLIANMMTGVSKGFERKLEINGLGLRAQVQGQSLSLSLGYSNPIVIQLPKGMKAHVDANTKITLSGPDKELLGRLAAEIRQLRLPEPYKGSGIKYVEEVITRKVGKTAGAGGTS